MHELAQPTDPPRGGIAVDDAFGGDMIDGRDSLAEQVAHSGRLVGSHGIPHLADPGTHEGLEVNVASITDGVLPDTLKGRLMIGQGSTSSSLPLLTFRAIMLAEASGHENAGTTGKASRYNCHMNDFINK